MGKKRKVRVELRKNRQKRTRANDLTRRYHQDDLKSADAPGAERVRAKGDLSRHRTIVSDSSEQADEGSTENALANLSVDLSECQTG
ncbi:MAG TPA: ribosome small subunit-dependent GTPase A, partial [Isosphaeraceae bacterium]|nr:ribosome small subunit-dependent GTPase A [Isosphaeraceae bacterium]